MAKELTPKQAAFVREYLIDLNATQAAIRAGYAPRSAGQEGERLLKNAEIAQAVQCAMQERANNTKIDAEWLLKRLADEATADITDLYDDAGALKPVHEWPLIWRQGLVQGIEVEQLFDGDGENRIHVGTVRKIKLDNRVKRLELIGKHVNVAAFEDRVKITGLDGLAERIARGKDRA